MVPFRRRSRDPATRIFFAADLHGSEVAFRKFLAAPAFYDTDVLVFGGDLMGKALVPVVRAGTGYVAEFHGQHHELDGGDALEAFVRSVETAGFYWAVVDRDEYAGLRADPLAVRGLFDRLARGRLASWIELAEERLAGTPVRCYLTGGNDDTPSLVSLLGEAEGEHVVACEGRVVELDGRHTMVTVGYSTPTPWDTPREVGEEVIAAAIEASVANVPDPARCVFNLHAPPIGSVLDRVVKLERTGTGPDALRPVHHQGRLVYTSAGSRAVREAIERYQPVTGLHGHVHESPGRIRIGRTHCFNPGSEYGQGILRGVIVAIRDGRLVGYQHTSG